MNQDRSRRRSRRKRSCTLYSIRLSSTGGERERKREQQFRSLFLGARARFFPSLDLTVGPFSPLRGGGSEDKDCSNPNQQSPNQKIQVSTVKVDLIKELHRPFLKIGNILVVWGSFVCSWCILTATR